MNENEKAARRLHTCCIVAVKLGRVVYGFGDGNGDRSRGNGDDTMIVRGL